MVEHFYMKVLDAFFFRPRRLSHQLMRVVFFVYISITMVITTLQFVAEYKRTQDALVKELEVVERTFHAALQRSIWQMNQGQLETLANGLISMPIIEGLDIVNPAGLSIIELRRYPTEKKPFLLFSIEKNLVWSLNNNEIPLGVLKLYSSSNVVSDRVLFGFLLIAMNAAVKTAILWLLFQWVFQRFLGNPLMQLTGRLAEINLEDIGDNQIELGIRDKNELQTLQDQFNNMLLRIKQDKQALVLEEENRRIWLEKEVSLRTIELQESNAKLSHLASTDALTGITNRRIFLEQAQLQMDISVRQSTSLCLLVLDIDHFKTINDTYGHSAGDKVLCHFTSLILANLRKTDIFGRVGGEEFGLLLIDTDLDAAANLAEKLRKKVFETRVDYEGKEIIFSVSIGVSRRREETRSVTEFFVSSDDMLYRAKKNGRNRVEK
jgi:diguanylate cyclase (GGDEF)-like protein